MKSRLRLQENNIMHSEKNNGNEDNIIFSIKK